MLSFLKDNLYETEDVLESILNGDPSCFRDYIVARELVKENLLLGDRTYIKFQRN